MKISELIAALESVKAKHGDCEVARGNHDIDYGHTTEPIEGVEVHAMVRSGGYAYDLPEPGRVAELEVAEIE